MVSSRALDDSVAARIASSLAAEDETVRWSAIYPAREVPIRHIIVP